MKNGIKGTETKNKLLHIAIHEFASMGFENTKVDTIVREANLTKPSLYIYFKSKQAIFDEIVNICTLKLETEVKKIGLTQLNNTLSQERIKNVLENFYEFVLENKELMIIGIILNKNNDMLINKLADIVKSNLRIEANINYIKSTFANNVFADILVTNSLMLCKNYLLTGKSSPKELVSILSSLYSESIFK
ncbi:TetR/AcrR family transcriptional regulator [Clostridium neuense]|uniref:TetR/AcrR family transcriptional regulator n=1 Tax=Clostridium neuense TaxID=1728934 RepID=A0ABW8TAC8_9CLOT